MKSSNKRKLYPIFQACLLKAKQAKLKTHVPLYVCLTHHSCFITQKTLKNVMSYHTFQQLHQSYLHSHPHHHKPKNVVCRGNCCTKIHQLYIYFPLGR